MNGPFKSYSILALIFLSLMAGGYIWAGRQGLMWAFVLTLIIHWLLYKYFDRHTLHLFDLHRLEGQDPWKVGEFLDKICQQARIPLPYVYVIDCPPLINSFSLAKQQHNGAILLSRSLLEKLEPEELRAVLALEVARIRRLDTVASSLACAFSEIVLLIPRLFESRYRWQKNPPPWLVKRNPLNHLLMHVFAPPAWFFRRLLVSPRSFYAADELAARYIPSPHALAQALWKIDSYAHSHNLDVPAATAHLFAVNPLTSGGWTRYFQAQPPVAKRIHRLTGESSI